MIIENTIYKEKIEENTKIFFKYASLQKQKKLKFLVIFEMCCGSYLILSYWLLKVSIFFPIFGSIGILWAVANIVRFNKSQKKLYDKVLKEEINKFGDQDFIYRKYIFDKRDLLLQTDYGFKKNELKFSFNNYYKLWIEEKNNVIIMQFNKKPDGKIVIIYYNDIGNFKQYCTDNDIKYIIVEK